MARLICAKRCATPPDDAAVRELLLTALQRKPLEHQFRGAYQPCRPMTAIGG